MRLLAPIRWRRIIPVLTLMCTSTWCVCQDSTPLGDVARQLRKQREESASSSSKTVYTNNNGSGTIILEARGAVASAPERPSATVAADAGTNAGTAMPAPPTVATTETPKAPPATPTDNAAPDNAADNTANNTPENAAAEADPDPQAVPAGRTGVTIPWPRRRPLTPEERAERQRRQKKQEEAAERDPALGPPLTVSGTLTAGYYSANTRNGHVAEDASPLGSVRLNASGYYHSPDFLKFDFKPQASLGRQSSETVFPDGQGFTADATFLSRSIAPVTFSYTKVNRKISTFGPLDQLAGLDADTSQNSLSVDWRIHPKRMPELDLNFSKYSDSYEPLENIAPRTENRAKLFSAALQHSLAKWKLQTRYRKENSNQDLINIFDPTQAPFNYQRDDSELQGSASRDFGTQAGVTFVGGVTKANSQIGATPYDQSFKFVTGSTHFRPTEKLTVVFRAGLTDNLVGATLQQTIAPNQTSTPQIPGQSLLLLPTEAHLTLQSYSGHAQYEVTKDLRLDGDVSRDSTSSPAGNTLVTPNSSLNSVQAGVGYAHHFSFWQFQSHYGVNKGLFDYGTIGSSNSFGHNANLSVTVGSLKRLELTGAVQGNLQNVHGATDVHDQSWDASLTASRELLRNAKLQVMYDRGRNLYRYSATHYESSGQGLGVSLMTPRFEFNVTHHIRDGLTFQADPRLQFLTPEQVLALGGAFPGVLLVPSSANWSNASFGFHPAERLSARFTFMQNRQSLNSNIHNNYTEWEASAGYQFRSLQFDFGYIHHDQDFGVDFFRRSRMYFRVVRDFKLF